MRYTLALLAAALAVEASPLPFAQPQAVTAHISPSGKPPPGCNGTYSGTFGLAVMNITAAATTASTSARNKVVTTISDGQPQQPTGAAALTTIGDGQPQAPTGTMAGITTIGDGQPQAPTGTMAPITTIGDGQPQAPTGTMAPITTIGDGQPQAPTGTSMAGITTIGDGQPQAPTGTSAAGITTIGDGQPQAPTGTSAAGITTIGDGQPQAPTGTSAAGITTIGDGQPQAPTGTSASGVTTIGDGQPQAPTGTSATGVGTMSDGQPTATPLSRAYVGCKTNHTLTISLEDGIMMDDLGRTGYIAANYQFQFDKPPQAGAIYTAGWSVCANSSLALGGSNVFWQCLSGNFFNLYSKSQGGQCSPITLNALELVQCAT